MTDRGAKRAKLWLDRYQIEPAEAFTPVIEKAVREAQLIVPVLSRNWVGSDWCRREVEAFGESHPDAARIAHLHHKAHEACFIANSVTTNVSIEH